MTEHLKPGVALLAETLVAREPRHPLHRPMPLTLGGRNLVLTFGPPQDMAGACHGFTLGDQIAVLDLPAPTLEWLLGTLGAPCPSDPMQRGMLIELACLDLLAGVEAALGPVRSSGKTSGATIPLGVDAATDTGTLSFTLHLSEPLAEALASYLDRHAAPPAQPDPETLAVPVTLRIGQQFLTQEEIATLSPGDVVMLEPGPALLVTEGFAAAVELAPSGPVARSDLLPLSDPRHRPDRHITFEAAMADMTLAVLNTLGDGTSLALAAFAGSGIDIVAEGRVLGRGLPVTIGSGTGIRILHISDGAKAQ